MINTNPINVSIVATHQGLQTLVVVQRKRKSCTTKTMSSLKQQEEQKLLHPHRHQQHHHHQQQQDYSNLSKDRRVYELHYDHLQQQHQQQQQEEEEEAEDDYDSCCSDSIHNITTTNSNPRTKQVQQPFLRCNRLIYSFCFVIVTTILSLSTDRIPNTTVTAFVATGTKSSSPFLISRTKLHVSNDFTRSSSSIAQFGFHSNPHQNVHDNDTIHHQQQQQQQNKRFGRVRKRFRAVLEYAKRRTGITPTVSIEATASRTTTPTLSVHEKYKKLLRPTSSELLLSVKNNNNDIPDTTAAQVIAEAASIGGMSDTSADFVMIPLQPPSATPKNGSSNNNNTNINGIYNPTISSSNGMKSSSPAMPIAVRANNGMISLNQVQGRNGTEIGVALKEQQQQQELPTAYKVNGSTTSSNQIASQQQVKPPFSQKPQNVQVDGLLNSGVSGKIKPLPFRLPKLSNEQKQRLMNGERIQEQSKMGRDGSGYVVLDIKAPDYVVWECLLDFEKYPEYIGTVRSMQMFTNTHLKQSYIAEKPVLPGTGRETRHYGIASITRASFVLSKFLLKIAAIHQYYPHPNGHYMIFTLDKANKNVVLKDAKGIWYTECNPDGRTGYTRVWLLCELSVSRVLPTFIVDYAAKRAMPRASNWIKPVVERVKKEFNIMD